MYKKTVSKTLMLFDERGIKRFERGIKSLVSKAGPKALIREPVFLRDGQRKSKSRGRRDERYGGDE